MEEFKKSPLYLWLEKYGYNSVTDASTLLGVSSESSVDDGRNWKMLTRDEKVLESTSESLKQKGSSRDEKVLESTSVSLKQKGSSRDEKVLESTSVSLKQKGSSRDEKVLESTSESLKQKGSSRSVTNEQTPVIRIGSISECSYPSNVASRNDLELISNTAYSSGLASPHILETVSSSSLYQLSSTSELTKELSSLYQLSSSDELRKELISRSEASLLPAEGGSSDLGAPSKTSTTFQEENIHKGKLKQISIMYDRDDLVDIHKSYSNEIKKFVHYLISSVAFRIFGIFLIFLDMSLVAIDLHQANNKMYMSLEYRSVSLAIALFFLVDVLLRVYVEGKRHYFSDLLNTLDAVVIGVTLLLAITYVFYDRKFFRDIPRLAVLFRPLRFLILIRILQLAHQKRHLERLTRRLVSGNKRRYRKDGFDLDLTYVTERIIAMSFPASGRQSLYRNPIKEVVRFLDTKHPNHYQVYNLCSERAYDPKRFHYRVRRIMIDDHNVPSLEEMLLFSKEVKEWMAQDPENVIAVHCKGGKGRTGTMVCACLLASEIVVNAKEGLFFFGERRTDKTSSSKFQGVETPSQLTTEFSKQCASENCHRCGKYMLRQFKLEKNRYVEYFEKLKVSYHWALPSRKILVIKRFIIYSIYGVGRGDGGDLEIQMLMWQETIFSCFSSKNCMIFHDIETDRVIINVLNCPALYDDVKVKFLSSNLPKYYDDCSFFFWFHTAFIRNNRLYLPRQELDNPHKSKTWKVYGPKFAVEVFFGES